MLFIYLALIVFFCLVMVKATDILMDSVRTLVISTNVGAYGIASFLLAFSTSLPELVVGITAGLDGRSELALGTVLGSNIANLTLVLGGAALISGALKSTDEFLKREVFYVFLAGSLPLVLLMDGTLNKMDGMILLLVYFIYNLTVLDRKRESLAQHEVKETAWWRRVLIRASYVRVERSVVMLVVGAALLIFAAGIIVKLAVAAANLTNIPVMLIGLFVVAIGTSLPELVFEIVAVKKKEVAMAFGNILGSVVTNSTLVLGITVLISEIKLQNGLEGYLLATMAFIVAFFLFWLFVWTKHRLERWEGVALVAFYVLFVWVEVARVSGIGP